jgi:predicted ABC-type transport system involved in lysophospholipase L1 biosynthesis ATPase subunit
VLVTHDERLARRCKQQFVMESGVLEASH